MDKDEREYWDKRIGPPTCFYCDGLKQIETDNNGPIVSCPICEPEQDRNTLIPGAVYDTEYKPWW